MPTSFQTFNPGDLIEDTHVEQFIEPIQNLESGKPWYGDDTGSANAFAVDLDPAPSAYTEGLMVHFLATNNVTGATTLNVNSLGTKALLKEGGDALASGDIVADQMVSAIYDGADFRVLSAVMNPTISPTAPPPRASSSTPTSPRKTLWPQPICPCPASPSTQPRAT
jgi:hypothetical protein